jgi:hypothetical protein
MKHAVLYDGHVHVYPCFPLADFLAGALHNFRHAARQLGYDTASDRVLCLTEGAGYHWFDETRRRLDATGNAAPLADAPGWLLKTGDDDVTLIARWQDGGEIHLLAGRQIVTAEGLEVLALGLASPLPDGEALPVVCDKVRELGAVAVLPWGVGKWLGRRGDIMQRLVQSAADRGIVLGDNGNRPWCWPLPALFRGAAVRNLPGSDPLPFATEAGRAGSFGFVLPSPLAQRPPLTILREVVAGVDQPLCYGRAETLLHFLRNQILSQLRKRRSPSEKVSPA